MLRLSLQVALGLTLLTSVDGMAQTLTVTAPTQVVNHGSNVYRVKAAASAALTAITVTVETPAGYSAYLQAGTVYPRTQVAQPATTINVPESVYNSPIEVRVRFEQSNRPAIEKSVTVFVDSLPPRPLTPLANRLPGGTGSVRIPFDNNDLSETVSANSFRIYQSFVQNNGVTAYALTPIDGAPVIARDQRSITLNFRNLNPGSYRLVISELSDSVGNPFSTPGATSATSDTNPTIANGIPFSVSGGPVRGEQVEYPQFLQPKNVESEFDPGDRVDTRVVRLYYFRDARRVAELINRNVENLNQQGYEQAQRWAERARREAEERIDERRMKEVLAVEAARRTREIERRMQQTRQELEQAYGQQNDLRVRQNNITAAMDQSGTRIDKIDADITAAETTISELPAKITTAQKLQNEVAARTQTRDAARATYNADKSPMNKTALDKAEADLATALAADPDELRDQLTREQTKLITLRALKTNLTINGQRLSRVGTQIQQLETSLNSNQLPQDLIDQQDREITSRNAVVAADALELRASEERFRRELAAGLADPDTYAKGKLTSIDPVTQVTISVVGTSRIQLRGPIQGINKICRLIHQIDSPVGQVKIGIHTVQVNGEHGDRMDYVYEKINREVAHSRFLVNTSAQLLRRAVAEVASEVALAADQGYLPDNCPPDLSAGFASVNGTTQTSATLRNRRYLYAFFGSDFIGELEEMDSELLNTENKMLSLNSMDTISLAGALSVTALADAPIRERIIMRVQELLGSELPDREFDYVRALTHTTRHGKTLQNRFRKAMRLDGRSAQEIYFNAHRTYTFPNTVTFFKQQIPGQGVLNPVQYATIKLAQTLKAQLVAEMELNNLVLERSLLETEEDETEKDYLKKHRDAEQAAREAEDQLVRVQSDIITMTEKSLERVLEALRTKERDKNGIEKQKELTQSIIDMEALLRRMRARRDVTGVARDVLMAGINHRDRSGVDFACLVITDILQAMGLQPNLSGSEEEQAANAVRNLAKDPNSLIYTQLIRFRGQLHEYLIKRQAEIVATEEKEAAEKNLFSKRLLNQFIDEQEEKSVELMEALRAHSSNVDNYLKRLAIAMEDDVQAQFYEPAFQRIRRVSRTWDVTLSQIETTTVLTNNRTLAKVSPSATFEFDLPKRDILLAEALNGSKALADEYGNLLKDGTFLAGAEMLSGQPAAAVVGDNAPMQAIPGLPANHQFGSDLQQLIPDPEIYKFETGTGFEIRPVIQPDGHSIVYTFDYLYSTNVREPVRADEKHLGRVKRHFVHTDVQTSSYELREITRYTVALKASRTGRGVPLFEDIPVVGAAFRPLPSDESSLQTNIILGSSTIYPTVFELMGLRWSRYVDDMASPALADQKQMQANRREELRRQLLHTTTGTVNKRIGLDLPSVPKLRQVRPGFRIPGP